MNPNRGEYAPGQLWLACDQRGRASGVFVILERFFSEFEDRQVEFARYVETLRSGRIEVTVSSVEHLDDGFYDLRRLV